MLGILATLLACTQGATGLATLAGQVVGPSGAPVEHARVFLEPGLAGALVEQRTDGAGRFRFDSIAPGAAGVFAWVDGFGFAGQHFNLAVDTTAENLVLRMRPAVQLEGRVVDPGGAPVAGARVTRAALLGESQVGIPLAKLEPFGFAVPVSGEDGRFSIPNLPEGGRVALKVAHPAFAQEGVPELPADARDAKVTLHPGVLVQGTVLTRGQGLAVAGAAVIIRNAQPPHDTAVTRSGGQGQFNIRLKPGVYLCQATSTHHQSPGWSELAVTGETAVTGVRLTVAGMGAISGTVKDAVTGAPIEGVRLSLETQGRPAAVTRTGPSGAFRFNAAEGANTVRLHPAAGYNPPVNNAWQIMVTEGQTFELPGLWFAPASGPDPAPPQQPE